MLETSESRRVAYNEACQFYWERLYDLVKTEIERYNGNVGALSRLSIGEFGEAFSAREFKVPHEQKELHPVLVERDISEEQVIEIVCDLDDGAHDRFILQPSSSNQVEAVRASAKVDILELVYVILKPLKDLGRVLPRDRDGDRPEEMQYSDGYDGSDDFDR